jgi:hypothetical protein
MFLADQRRVAWTQTAAEGGDDSHHVPSENLILAFKATTGFRPCILKVTRIFQR